MPLSELTLRYWFTSEGAQGQTASIDYARVGVNPVPIQPYVTSTFVAPTPVRMGANYYVQFGFTAAAGSMAATTGIAEVQAQFFSAGYVTNYTQTGDYSFDASKTAFADWTHVTLYRNSTLVWGIEPSP